MSSKIGRIPVTIPSGVSVSQTANIITIKGSKGELSHAIPSLVKLDITDTEVTVAANDGSKRAISLMGTTRAIINNHVTGVTAGFTKKLLLVGVGYKAQVKKNGNLFEIDMSLGLSHPAIYTAPEGVELVAVSATEIDVKGVDKQKVGQVAAEIRKFRKPEPYKGKGIRYSDEKIILREVKK